ncbi:hypothetical protein JG688_00009960 [Phytophthora aleatoria]|uniref:Uncharacterized protein n=1 Tax=Phytophthora aleatoria TaxID=2496075 RepID=A0A8J5M212_9STRA|nr:hypothetical protein JG688_00009960 [Phytophthora aleatoria]
MSSFTYRSVSATSPGGHGRGRRSGGYALRVSRPLQLPASLQDSERGAEMSMENQEQLAVIQSSRLTSMQSTPRRVVQALTRSVQSRRGRPQYRDAFSLSRLTEERTLVQASQNVNDEHGERGLIPVIDEEARAYGAEQLRRWSSLPGEVIPPVDVVHDE